VQSSFPDEQQGEISGLSRSVSNLGSSLGAAIAGTILVAQLATATGRPYALALIVLAAIAFVGLVAAILMPRGVVTAPAASPPDRTAPTG
jgi:predicted MFS family arabinose efflux permease